MTKPLKHTKTPPAHLAKHLYQEPYVAHPDARLAPTSTSKDIAEAVTYYLAKDLEFPTVPSNTE